MIRAHVLPAKSGIWRTREMGKRNVRFLCSKRDMKLTAIFTQFRAKKKAKWGFYFHSLASISLAGKTGEKSVGTPTRNISNIRACASGWGHTLSRNSFPSSRSILPWPFSSRRGPDIISPIDSAKGKRFDSVHENNSKIL